MKFLNLGEAGFAALGLTPLVPLRNVHMLMAKPGLKVVADRYQPTLILVRGLQGSGKSTLATQLTTIGYRHFEADMFYEDKGFDPRLLKEAHTWCLHLTQRTLFFGQLAVVCNTFSTVVELKPYLKLSDSTMIIETCGAWQSVHGISTAKKAHTANKWEVL